MVFTDGIRRFLPTLRFPRKRGEESLGDCRDQKKAWNLQGLELIVNCLMSVMGTKSRTS